jgi:hypothetical protein
MLEIPFTVYNGLILYDTVTYPIIPKTSVDVEKNPSTGLLFLSF